MIKIDDKVSIRRYPLFKKVWIDKQQNLEKAVLLTVWMNYVNYYILWIRTKLLRFKAICSLFIRDWFWSQSTSTLLHLTSFFKSVSILMIIDYQRLHFRKYKIKSCWKNNTPVQQRKISINEDKKFWDSLIFANSDILNSKQSITWESQQCAYSMV